MRTPRACGARSRQCFMAGILVPALPKCNPRQSSLRSHERSGAREPSVPRGAMACRAELGAVRFSARGVGGDRRRPQRHAACHHGLRQDLRGLVRHARPRCCARHAARRAAPSRCASSGSRRCARWPPTPPRALAAAAARLGARLDDRRSAPATRRAPSARGRTGACPPRWSRRRSRSALMLTREHARDELQACEYVIVDEWHELMGSKRGVQVQLALARLRRWNPALVVWGLSATLGNLRRGDAGAAAADATAARRAGARPASTRTLVIDTLMPARPGPLLVGRPPGRADAAAGGRRDREARRRRWSSPTCARRPRSGTSCCSRRGPTGPATIALHHGSLDKATREWVELGLKEGALEGRGGDLVARPRRRLPAGRARAADRLGQGRRAAAAARRPQRPCAGARQPRHAGADQHAGDRRGGRRAARGAGGQHREAARRRTSRSTCWCSTW